MKKSRSLRYLKCVYPYLIIFLFTIVLLYPQIEAGAYLSGRDTWFHMNQFYDTAMQMRTGHFSYFISRFGFGGVGRIVNAVYGPGFDYLFGIVLLLFRTWYHFELIQNFIFLMLSGSLFFVLFRKNKVTSLIGTLLSILYMMTQPIMSLVIGWEFNGIETVLLPLVLIQGTQMVRNRQIHPLALGVTMAIVFQAHMLTTLMGTLILIPFFVYTWVLTSQKKALWKKLGLSVGLTILLTANVWGAMLNVLLQRLIPPVPQGRPTAGGSLAFLIPGHYFSLLGLEYSGIIAFLIICGIVSLLFWRKTSTIYKITLLTGLFFMWLSSIYVPWSWVLKIYPAFKYQIQYPKRFLSVGILMTFLASGMLFSKLTQLCLIPVLHRSIVIAIPVILLVFSGAGYVYQRSNVDSAIRNYDSKKVIAYHPFHKYVPTRRRAHQLRDAYKSSESLDRAIELVHQDTPDYLPVHRTIHDNYQYHHNGSYSGIEKQIYRNLSREHFRRHVAGNRLTLTWRQHRTRRNVILPLIKYRDTRVRLDHHKRFFKTSRIGALKVPRVTPGRHTASIRYAAPWWLISLIWITVVSWLAVIVRATYKVTKNSRLGTINKNVDHEKI